MKFIVWVRPWMIEDAEETIEVSADTREEAECKASKLGYVMMMKMKEKNSIRYIVGEMPFDREGIHATGREVLRTTPAGTLAWYPEYEDDDTWDDTVTESDADYEKRYEEYEYENA